MQFRKATTDDAQQLSNLRLKQLIEEARERDISYDHAMDEMMHRELMNYFTTSIADGSLAVWVAVEKDRIVATSGVCYFQYPPTFTNVSGKTGYITDVYTDVDFRKQGIATKLLEFTMEEMKEHGCVVARLHASAQGKGLYEKIGFGDTPGFMMKKIK